MPNYCSKCGAETRLVRYRKGLHKEVYAILSRGHLHVKDVALLLGVGQSPDARRRVTSILCGMVKRGEARRVAPNTFERIP